MFGCCLCVLLSNWRSWHVFFHVLRLAPAKSVRYWPSPRFLRQKIFRHTARLLKNMSQNPEKKGNSANKKENMGLLRLHTNAHRIFNFVRCVSHVGWIREMDFQSFTINPWGLLAIFICLMFIILLCVYSSPISAKNLGTAGPNCPESLTQHVWAGLHYLDSKWNKRVALECSRGRSAFMWSF